MSHLHQLESLTRDHIFACFGIVPSTRLLQVQRGLRCSKLAHLVCEPANKIGAVYVIGRKARDRYRLGLVYALIVMDLCAKKAVAFLLHIVVDNARHFLLPDFKPENVDIILRNGGFAYTGGMRGESECGRNRNAVIVPANLFPSST